MLVLSDAFSLVGVNALTIIILLGFLSGSKTSLRALYNNTKVLPVPAAPNTN